MAEHAHSITNDVGHPKSFYVDRGLEEGFVLETCMYFPFVTAKNLSGFGADHEAFMQAFPRLQMILVLACDKAVPCSQLVMIVASGATSRCRVNHTHTPPVMPACLRA